VSAIIAFSCALSLRLLGQVPEIKQVEERTLAQRRTIQSGHFIFKSHYEQLSGGHSIQREFRVWLDGARNRTDMLVLENSFSKQDGFREVHCRNCEEAKYIFFTDFRFRPGTLSKAYLLQAPKDDAHDIDPRMLGMFPASLLENRLRHLESAVGAPDRNALAIVKDVLNGAECERVQFSRANGAKFNIWIVPAMGNSVRRIECSNKVAGVDYLDVALCEYGKYRVGDVQYPSKCVYVRYIDGKADTRETVEVTAAEWGKAPDPKVFSLAGMDIPKDQPFFDSKNKRSDWDGNQLVPPREPPPNAPLGEAPARTTRTDGRYLAGAVVLGLVSAVAGFLIVRSVRRSKLPV
jgi:hypothetical protein